MTTLLLSHLTCAICDFESHTRRHLIKFGESFSLGSLLNQSQTYQGNPCGVYPDLSSFTGSGVYPDLFSFTGSGVIQKLFSLYQTFRPVRFTSSGIRALALDIGSILSYPIFFLCNLSKFVFCPCSVICVLVCVLFRSCLGLIAFWVFFVLVLLFVFLFASCCILVFFRLCVKKNLFEFCFK